MLSFAKYLVLKKDFDFETADMLMIRNKIRSEFEKGYICTKQLIKTTRSRLSLKGKRKINQAGKKIVRKENIHRTIVNPDAQTCWLNSCLQLILTAKDQIECIVETGSVLWEHLLWLQGKDHSVVLDPTDIKQIIINAERERILRSNIQHNNMLFDLGTVSIYSEEGNKSVNRIGQHDCKDFFYSITENQDKWPDLFNLFKVNTLEKTQCLSCQNISQQDVSANHSTFLMLDCPNRTIMMKEYLENNMNGYEKRFGWRDENGCG